MKIKELIKWLKKHDPEADIGILDIGQDSGDYTSLEDLGDTNQLYPNLKIKRQE
jgi:hypothetical protein